MTLAFGLIVGLALGLTGGGGSIFAVPLLIYGLGVSAHDAIGISLAVVALTAAVGAVGAMRAQLIEFRAGFIFAAAGMLAAPFGITFAHGISEVAILIGFAFLTVIVAGIMWWRASRDPQATTVVRAAFAPSAIAGTEPICRFNPNEQLRLTAPCSLALAASGVGVGLLSGLFGVGGGFIIVPALIFVTRMGIHRAVASSLFVIALVGLSGVGAILFQGRPLPWELTSLFVAGGIAGMLLGRLLARRMAGPNLQKFFALAMLMVGVFVFVSKLS